MKGIKKKTMKNIEKIYKDNRSTIMNIMKKTNDFAEFNSTCSAKHVGCFITTTSFEIIGKGYNHSLIDIQCNELFYKKNNEWYSKITDEVIGDDVHRNWSLVNEVHAEDEAVKSLFLINNYLLLPPPSLVGMDKYAFITYSPCTDCIKELIIFNIKTIFYNKEFDQFDKVKELCEKANVELMKVIIDGEE